MMKIKIAILDDHPIIIKGLMSLLGQIEDMTVTGAFQSPEELFGHFHDEEPHILFLDIQLPGISGDELVPDLQKRYPNLMVIAFTHMEQEYYLKSMLENNIMGYVLKSSSEEILLEAIRSVNKGIPYFDKDIRKTVAKLQSGIYRKITLTQREKEILQLMTEDLSSHEIAHRIQLNKRTVDAHRLHLLQKLGVKNSASLVKKAMDIGILK